MANVTATAPATKSSSIAAGWITIYSNSLQAGWQSVGGCSGAPPAASSIFFLQSLSGLGLAYRGATVAITQTLGRRVVIQAASDVESATLAHSDPRLNAPNSPYIAGVQLPGKPLHSGALTADWKLKDERTELLANAQWVSANNDHQLPGYTYFTAGLTRQLGPALTLTAVITNIGNLYAADFGTPRYAMPLPTAGGGYFQTVAKPLPRPQFFVQLSWHGASASGSQK